jgi:hypothetical protein
MAMSRGVPIVGVPLVVLIAGAPGLVVFIVVSSSFFKKIPIERIDRFRVNDTHFNPYLRMLTKKMQNYGR